jgi:putative transposase
MPPEPRYRHWQNTQNPGSTCFVTATCLDFAHLFRREELRTIAMESLIADAVYYKATLHAFVVMTHHLHILVTPNEESTISELMKSIKRNITKKINPLLNDFERSQLTAQSGLNRSTLWKDSFRGLEIRTEEVFLQKIQYIHTNPVRGELTEWPTFYQWSSAYWYEQEMQLEGWQLDCPRILATLRTS